MKKREAAMQTVFKHWLQAKWNNGSAAFELKRTLTDRFYIADLQEHQVVALRQAYKGTLYHKIADDSIGIKPFDCFILQGALAFVVIGFGARLTEFFVIPIWVWDEKTVGKKSVTSTEVANWPDVERVKLRS
jgi:hypothetical protein